MEFTFLLAERNNGLGIITINRPEVRNALHAGVLDEMVQALELFRNDSEVRVVVFTGAGDKAFAAGADIAALREKSMLDALVPGMQAVYNVVENYDKPVIAAINGFALGGGCELAMACDIRIASENAKFGLPELNLAIIPGAGGTQRMTRLLGKGKTKELIFTGDIIPASEALEIGLVNKVVPHDQLFAAVTEMAEKMMKKGPLALRLAKLSINAGAETDLQTGLLIEKISQAIAFSTEDKLEGTSAFLEKRPPQFGGK
jgi:enoyl-CoA hydratase